MAGPHRLEHVQRTDWNVDSSLIMHVPKRNALTRLDNSQRTWLINRSPLNCVRRMHNGLNSQANACFRQDTPLHVEKSSAGGDLSLVAPRPAITGK